MRSLCRRAACTAVLCCVPLLLGGCLGARAQPPSSAEVASAVRAVIAANHANFGNAASAAPSVSSVQNFGCAAAPDGRGYLCQTHIVLAGGKAMDRLIRMVNAGAGWHAVME